MITVEVVQDEVGTFDEIVEIYFDKDGLLELSARLQLLLEGKADHIHLMSESWGLGDLDEKTHKKNNRLAHHLQLSLVDE
jgi:hypothetical protein